jgi:lipase maturation factor
LRTKASSPVIRCTYWLTRFVILRLVGLVYLAAFLTAARQSIPLLGERGLLPIRQFLARARQSLGSSKAGFLRWPSLFWWNSSDTTLLVSAWTGVTLSALVFWGWANAPMLLLLWLLYMSFVHCGRDWYRYGWEVQLLETGFLAIFLAPFLSARPFPRRPPPLVIFWLFRWLIFRIMLGAGLIKMRGDRCWRDLTALDYHFETQPLPNALSRWFHFLPRPLLRTGVVFNHIAELVAPWFAFGPRTLRQATGGLMVLFQGTLILSGNLSFLNWLTIIPALACLDDRVWRQILPQMVVRRAEAAAAVARPCGFQGVLAYAVAAIVVFLSKNPVANLFSRRQIMNTSFDPLNLVNTYGAFGSVGRERLNVIFEGTDGEVSESSVWKEYIYKGLPVELDRMPRQVAPYQLRLDWQMWFAAMSTPYSYPWVFHLVWKLLHNDAGTLSLFAYNPFPEHPPRYIRAVLYRYSFVKPQKSPGLWWNRERLGLWLPPLRVESPRLISLLHRAGWLGSPEGSSFDPFA